MKKSSIVNSVLVLAIVLVLGFISTKIFAPSNFNPTNEEKQALYDAMNVPSLAAIPWYKSVPALTLGTVSKEFNTKAPGATPGASVYFTRYSFFLIPIEQYATGCWIFRPGVDDMPTIGREKLGVQIGRLFCDTETKNLI